MSVSFVGATNGRWQGSGTATVNYPAGVQDGDTLLVVLSTRADSADITAVDASWTKLDTDPYSPLSVFSKKWDSAANDTYASFSNCIDSLTRVYAYRGLESVPQSAYATGTGSVVIPQDLSTGQCSITVALTRAAQGTDELIPEAGANDRGGFGHGGTYGGSHIDSFKVADWIPAYRHMRGPEISLPESASWEGVTVLLSDNTGPNAPAVGFPESGTVLNRGVTNRFSWAFSDPDAGDFQSAFDLQYWLLDSNGTRATADPATVSQSVPNEFWDAAPATFADGSYEWQVRTYDSMGVTGPWSASGFFTAHDDPDPPTITTPINNGTVQESESVSWSTPTQDAYQVRRVADDGTGLADTSTIYFDTGEVVSTSRSLAVEFETNKRYEHVQIRVKYQGLWSLWADVLVYVSFTRPRFPSFTLSPNNATASILVTITNPTPAASEPAVTHNEVWIDDGSGFERRAAQVSPNGSWRYWTPISGKDYTDRVRVVAFGNNGTTSTTSMASA